MKIFLSAHFQKTAKKFHRNQVTALKKAIEKIQHNPAIGDLKIGDLAGVRVYKFHIAHQLILLTYTYDEHSDEAALLYFAPQENFYEVLKKKVN